MAEEAKKVPTRSEALAAFLGAAAKNFGAGRVTSDKRRFAIRLPRISSGSFDLDEVLGGGWPFARICLLHGKESSGKTLLAIILCVMLQSWCYRCRLHRRFCLCPPPFVGCKALWVDQEGTLDREWAEALGMDFDHHVVARMDCAEDAIDLITTALASNAVEFIVGDSLEAFVPKEELEKSASDAVVGKKALLLNRAFRAWGGSLNRIGQSAPGMLFINQEREKIGVMFGDPMTLPGGKGQLFASSIIVRLMTPKVEDDKDSAKESASVTVSGVTRKNKTFPPKLEFAAKFAIKSHSIWEKGEFLNAQSLCKRAKMFKMFGDTGHRWVTGRQVEDAEATAGALKLVRLLAEKGGKDPKTVTAAPVLKPEVIEVKTDAAMVELINSDPELEQILWGSVIGKSYD